MKKSVITMDPGFLLHMVLWVVKTVIRQQTKVICWLSIIVYHQPQKLSFGSGRLYVQSLTLPYQRQLGHYFFNN